MGRPRSRRTGPADQERRDRAAVARPRGCTRQAFGLMHLDRAFQSHRLPQRTVWRTVALLSAQWICFCLFSDMSGRILRINARARTVVNSHCQQGDQFGLAFRRGLDLMLPPNRACRRRSGSRSVLDTPINGNACFERRLCLENQPSPSRKPAVHTKSRTVGVSVASMRFVALGALRDKIALSIMA